MIIHGILANVEVDLAIKLLLNHPDMKPNKETKECWVDRTNHTPKPKKIRYSPVCGRGISVYKERWR